jgi:hypothetical protein
VGHRVGAAMTALAVVAIGSTAALALTVVGAAGGETPVTVTAGDESPASFSFGISPKLLTASDPGATKLQIHLEGRKFFGPGTPPGIKEAKIGLDRSIRFEPGTLPVCRWPAVESGVQIQAAAPEKCSGAVVGGVEATVMFAYPENTPIRIPVKGKIYSGGVRHGTTYLLVELPIGPILNGAVRLIVPVRPVGVGRIGSEATIRMPNLGEGAGRLLKLDFELKRGFDQNGERSGFVTAECRDGKLAATLAAVFTDGTQFTEESVRACAPRRRQ